MNDAFYSKLKFGIIFGIFLLALFFRVHLASFIKAESGGDVYNNLFITTKIAEFQNPFTEKRLPFYPFLLLPAHVTKLIDPITWAVFVSSLSALAVMWVALKLARKFNINDWLSILMLVLISFNTSFFRLSIRPLSNTTFAALVLLSIYLAYQAKSKKDFLMLGIAMGLASITRHEALVTSGIFALYFLIKNRTHIKEGIEKIAFMLVPFVLITAPLFITNIFKSGNPFQLEYISTADEALYPPHTTAQFIENLTKVKMVIMNLWFDFPITIHGLTMYHLLSIALLFFFTYGFFVFIKKYKFDAFPLIVVLLSQIGISLWLQPTARYFQQSIAVISLLIVFGIQHLLSWGLKDKKFEHNQNPFFIAVIIIISWYVIIYGVNNVSKKIEENNREQVFGYLLLNAVRTSEKLPGKIGMAADFPEAVYYLNSYGDNSGVFYSSRPAEPASLEEQEAWLKDNQIRYYIWDSEHQYLDIFKKKPEKFKVIKTSKEGLFTVTIYKIK